MRAAKWLHEGAPGALSCPFCSAAVSSWGGHLLAVCPKLAQGVLIAFRAVATVLDARGCDLEWVNATSFWMIPEGGLPRRASPVRDHEVPEQGARHQAYMLWSGLWVDRDPEAASLGVHRQVMLGYAAALEEAMKEGKWPLFRDEALAVPGI